MHEHAGRKGFFGRSCEYLKKNDDEKKRRINPQKKVSIDFKFLTVNAKTLGKEKNIHA